MTDNDKPEGATEKVSLAKGPDSEVVEIAPTDKPAEPKKADLIEDAKAAGIEIPSKATKEEIAKETFFVGFWKKHKQWGCPHCQFRTLSGARAVQRHIVDTHIRVTTSSIAGPDGQPVVKVETQ